MCLLAIERSSAIGSAAIFKDGVCLLETSVELRPGGIGPDACAMVTQVLDESGAGVETLSSFAVGLGPGSFSGIRSALAFVTGMALPDGLPIIGIGSAMAVAWGVMQTTGAASVSVVGDARRGSLWLTTCQRSGTSLKVTEELRLVPRDQLAAELPEASLVATPDWPRLGDWLKGQLAAERLLAQAALPRARAIGELALEQSVPRVEPPLPLYLHPAVATH